MNDMEATSHEEVEQTMQAVDLLLRGSGHEFDDSPRWSWIADESAGEGGE